MNNDTQENKVNDNNEEYLTPSQQADKDVKLLWKKADKGFGNMNYNTLKSLMKNKLTALYDKIQKLTPIMLKKK